MSEAKELRQLSLMIEQLKRDHRAEYDYYHPLLTAADELAEAVEDGCCLLEADIVEPWKVVSRLLAALATYREARKER